MRQNHKIVYDASSIGSLQVLAKTLDISVHRIQKIASVQTDFYTIFEKQVKNKIRELAEPKAELKIIHKRIISRIFSHFRFPHYLHGGIKADTPRDFISNASAHAACKTAIAMDIKSFYPSITYEHVYQMFLRLCKFPPQVSEALAGLTTLNGSVPQGAPTSSYIANLVIWDREYKLASLFEQKGFVYTRLIDDITVSTEKSMSKEAIENVIKLVSSMLVNYGFKIHPDKTQIYSKSNPEKLMLITGLWLNRGMPRLDADKRVKISASVTRLTKNGVKDCVSDEYHQQHSKLAGQVALLKRLKHVEAGQLRKLLDATPPIFEHSKIAKIQKVVKMFVRKEIDSSKLGYLQRFFHLQHQVSIVKRTNPRIARQLQIMLNKRRPTSTKESHYA
ncbi:reverse transcriptase [Undibacterium sp. YM2]|uniref:reverse transcriptase family protein n=1 Tax=Undibacterium sp. YM2 TaxID=2058625 RepID=UPI001331EBB6|nr:reverse transcriptase family protein [Undibacterium sp. YM2]BBB67891.1 reverse transcriptase [Undibacterium sp. YM2]